MKKHLVFVVIASSLVNGSMTEASFGNDGPGSNFQLLNGQEVLAIQVNGSPKTFDLSGARGSAGLAQDGSNAVCPPGLDTPGAGSDGFALDGADGDDGKDAIIEYSSLSDLRALSFDQSGGAPGLGAGTANGGRGCNNGPEGRSSSSSNGRASGGYGSVFLVPPQSGYAAERRSVTLPLSEVLSSDVQLSANLWTSHNGIAQLVAPGSLVADPYYLYNGSKAVSVHFVWSAPVPAQNYSAQSVVVSTSDSGQVKVNFSGSNNLIDSTITYNQSGNATVTINRILQASDLNNYSASLSGTGVNTVLQVTANSNTQDVGETNVDIVNIKEEGGLFGHTLYKLEDTYDWPENTFKDLFVKNATGMLVKIGRFPSINLAALSAGKIITVKLTVRREKTNLEVPKASLTVKTTLQ